MANELETIGQNVRRARMKLGWTQARLGEEVGKLPRAKAFPPSRVAEIEAGRFDIRVGTLAKIAAALGLSSAALLIPHETEAEVA